MALAFKEPMRSLLVRWDGLGYGVGVAYGYATLGTVGFEGRRDSTAVGSVVNLAARLCGEAGAGEVLVDKRTHDAVVQCLK